MTSGRAVHRLLNRYYQIMSNKQRLQKLLAQQGLGSRRAVEAWIKDGRLTVNGELAELGAQASLDDTITLDGKPVKLQSADLPTQTLMYHKPLGEVCTRDDPQGRPTVFERLPKCTQGRWIMVGRLDVNTTGLLLFTSDGELANQLMHPKHTVERTYWVSVTGGTITPEAEAALTKGVMLEDGLSKFDSLKVLTPERFIATLHRGKNREVRRLCESQGLTVDRLKRIQYGEVNLPQDLQPGQWRFVEG